MDKETLRLQTGRSSPKTPRPTDRYAWPTTASTPRYLPNESLIPRSSAAPTFESIDNQRTAYSLYEVRSTPRSLPHSVDAVSHYNLRASQAHSEKGLRAATESLSDLPSCEGSRTSHPSHSDADAVVKPGEYNVVASPIPGNLTLSPPSITISSRRSHDVPGPLASSSRRRQDQRPTIVDSRIPSAPVSPNNSLDSSGPLKESVGPPNFRSAESSDSLRPQSEDVALSSKPAVNPSQEQRLTLSQRSAKSASTPKEPQSCESLISSNPRDEETSKDSSGFDSLVIRPGLHKRELSSISTASTDLTEATDSEDISPGNEPGPTSLATDRLIRHLITFLIARWLGSSLALDLNNPAETFRKCPQGSGTGQAGKSAGKRPLRDSPYQGDHQSRGGESGDGSDHEGDGDSGQRKRKNQKVDDSAGGAPQLLACPFYKMDPLRYSGLNEREKEYRHCSSGYWPDISRLK